MFTLLTNMTREELITQLYDGVVLMVLGMGTVFIFLVLLIYCSKLMSRICMKYEKNHPANAKNIETKSAAAPAQARIASNASATDDAAIAAAIAAAWDKSKN